MTAQTAARPAPASSRRNASWSAGVNVKALSTYMGDAAVTITLDRYGHLFPGHEAQVVCSFDADVARAAVRVRVREADDTP